MDSTPRLVRADHRDGLAWIELDHPPANTYSHEMMRQLDDAILAARFDEDVHAIVLRGRGERFFCAGADIAMLRAADPTWKYHFCLDANETLNRLEQTPKPVVAALNGHAVGGGFEVALAADGESFDAAVRDYTARFTPPQGAARAIGLVKRAVQSGGGLPLHEGLALERELQQRLFESDDAGEGLEAYVAKRAPSFRGR